MKLSLFKISILLIIIGALGTIIVFSESEKLEQFMTLKQTESDEISLYFEAGDIGYHKVTILEFDGQGFFYRLENPPTVEQERSTYLNLTAFCEWGMVFSFYIGAFTYRRELEGASI